MKTNSTRLLQDLAAYLLAARKTPATVKRAAEMVRAERKYRWVGVYKIVRGDFVIVVPFFISDGLHSYQDIPVLLGIETEPTAAASQRAVFRRNPHRLHGRELYYASAIGTEPKFAGIILEQVAAFDRTALDLRPIS